MASELHRPRQGDHNKLADSWATDGEQSKSCIFPLLNHEVPSDAEESFQTVAVDGSHMIDPLCDSNATSLVPLLLAVWSIILHRFADTEQVYFAVNVSKAPEGALGSIFHGEAIFTALLDAKTPIKQLLHVSSHNVCPLASDKQSCIRFNTGIQFVMGDKHGTSCQQHIQCHSSCGTDTKGCDIVLFAEKSPETLKLLLQYNTSILSPRQARAMAGAVTQALCSFRDDPAQSVKDVCLVDQKSWDDIVLWNSRPRDFPYNRSITEVISERSQSQPGGQAVFSWDGTLTYEELELYSSRLAGYLKELGVGTNVMVPLCFDRSIWAIVATLAVLKTGAAIIPMDASHPVLRLKQIVAQVKARFILVSECYATLLADTVDRVVSVSWSMVTGLPQYDNSIVHRHPRPQDVAYIIFTSGSTGNPKGCVVEHRALAGVEEHAEALRLTSDSRVLQFASYSFGLSLIEILCTLTAGGTICIPSKDARLNDLSGTIRRMMVNWALLTPSLVSSMDPGSSIDSGLRTMVLGGEPLSKHNLREWAARVCLIQVYGFNEAFGPCTIQVGITPTRSPHNIGTSSHAKLWLVSLDNHNVLAPIGAVAELVVEGGFLGREYLNDEERTEAAFIQNPVWLKGLRRDTKSRFYKTGDLVRYDLDGSIIHMGRKATHAKINGQRVELGEVEHHVHQHFDCATKTVAEAVTPAGSSGVPFLAVFVYCDKREATGQEGTNSSILVEADESFQQSSVHTDSILRGLLPEYMVPRLYLPLGRVPMTVSGKVDRRKLRGIVAETSHEALMLYAEPRPTIAAPTSKLEKRLQRLFAQVLCIREDAFGVNTSFFHLGGDSLKAMRISRLALDEGVPLTVENIFRQKSISSLASYLNGRYGGLLSPLVTYALPQTYQPLSLVDQDVSFTDLSLSSELIDPSNVVDVIPATESQVLFLTHWSSTFSSFLLRGQIDIRRLQYALGQLVDKHASLRTVFCEHRGNILQVVLGRTLPCFEHIHTDEPLEPVLRAVSDRESNHPSLSNQPFKVILASRSDDEHLLAIRLSHAQYDWYSLSILLRDLGSAYNNHSLPVSTTVSFPDYVYFCRQHPSEHANRFWSELLHGSHVTRIPLPSTNETDDTISIRESASATLPRLPPDTTHSILVNASVSLILSKLTDSSDVVFGLVVNTRSLSMQGIDSIVGPCINVLPLRIVLQKDQSASNLCMNLREEYANISQHCHLELSDIAGATDNWGTFKGALPFGCIVNHFSVDEGSEPLSLEGLSCSSFSTAARITSPNQVLIRSIIQGNTFSIEVLMSTGEGARDSSSKFARCLARAVLFTVEQLSKKFASPLSSMDIDLDGL